MINYLKIFKIYFAFVSIILCVNGQVKDITTSNFKSISSRKACKLFYVTEKGCSKCVKLFPKFEIASQTFKITSDVIFGKVEDSSIFESLDFRMFPSVVYYEFGSDKARMYDDDITVDTIVDLAIRSMRGNFDKMKRPHTLQVSASNFKDLVDVKSIYRFVMMYEDEEDEEVNVFEKVANTYRNDITVAFGRIDTNKAASLKKRFPEKDLPCLYWYPVDSKKAESYDGSLLDVEKLVTFINSKTGLQRVKGGELGYEAGRVKEMDEVLAKYILNVYEGTSIARIIHEDFKPLLSKVKDKKMAEYYIDILTKVDTAKSRDAIETERLAVEKELERTDIGPVQRDTLNMKMNVINKFVDELAPIVFQVVQEKHRESQSTKKKEKDSPETQKKAKKAKSETKATDSSTDKTKTKATDSSKDKTKTKKADSSKDKTKKADPSKDKTKKADPSKDKTKKADSKEAKAKTKKTQSTKTKTKKTVSSKTKTQKKTKTREEL